MYRGISATDSFNITHIIHIKLSMSRRVITTCNCQSRCQAFVLGRELLLGHLSQTVHLNYSLPSRIHAPITFSLMLSFLPSFYFTLHWQSAPQLLLPPSPCCLTAFLSFLLASCDWKRSETYWPQNSTLESYPCVPYVSFPFFGVLALSLRVSVFSAPLTHWTLRFGCFC